MTKLRFIGAFVLGALFLAMALRYSFYQPFIQDAVYDAIPAQATFTYKADSLESLCKSPVCKQLDNALGAGNSLETLLDSNRWVRLVAPSEVAVAAIPLRYAGQTKTWAAVSWVGWRSPWLRWKLEHTRVEGFSFLGKHAVWPIWKYETPDIARGTSLTFALTDKLFIVCLSETPSDILMFLDTYDRRIPSINDLK